MSPTRRTLVRSAVLSPLALVAGCLGSGGGGGGDDGSGGSGDDGSDIGSGDGDGEPVGDGPDTDTDGDDTSTDLPTDSTDSSGETRLSGGPGISLTGVDSAPDIPLEPTVEVTRPVANDDHPPQLRLTLTNTSDDFVEVGEGRAIFFQYVSDTSNDLIFLPAGEEYPAEPGCWRLRDPLAITMEYRIVSFEPGQSQSELVDLYGAASRNGGEETCLPVGEFRFETTYTVGGLIDTDEKRPQSKWGFSLSLE